MIPLPTAAEMRALDRGAIDEVGIPGAVLMETAGRGVADLIRAGLAGRRTIAVIAGPGNNGGDGYVIARVLGADPELAVTLYRAAARARVAGEAAVHLAALEHAGTVPIVDISSAEGLAAAAPELLEAEVVVDALLGTGVIAEVHGHLRNVLALMASLPGLLFAVDVPSGLDADRGTFHGPVLAPGATVSMAFPKLGLMIDPGFRHAGEVTAIDIGIPYALVEQVGVRAALLEARDVARVLPRREAWAHKGSAGHLLVLGGSPGKTGAALLSARAALRTGAGLATIAAARATRDALDRRVLEVMTADLGEDETLAALPSRAVEVALALAAGKSALVVGPGMRTDAVGAALVSALVEQVSVPMVIDADGLNHLAHDLGVLGRAKGPRVLTPHPGEMARLAGLDVASVQADRVGVARAFAERHGVVLVLKGARTLVAAPDGFVTVNPTGNPGLASGGTGDVLAGMLGALQAQGLRPIDAARAAVFLHGRAADRVVARRAGETLGLVASDLIRELPRTIAEVRRAR